MGHTYRKYISTAVLPAVGVVTKKVMPAIEGETEDQRHDRLYAQSAANRSRVTHVEGNVYTVSSQQRGEDGKPVTSYDVLDMGNGTYLCQCVFGGYNPGVECSHVARVREYRARKASERRAEAKKSLAAIQAIEAQKKAERLARRNEWREEVD